MTVQEATAINVLARHLGVRTNFDSDRPGPTADETWRALELLVAQSHKRLMAGVAVSDVRARRHELRKATVR